MKKPKITSTHERLQQFSELPSPPFHGKTIIRWDKHQIPFIEAEDDRDAAFALGMVQAHLRLGQMEVAKRIAAGRISEMAGRFAADIDESIRILGFSYAAEKVVANMDKTTKSWCQSYADGVNFYKKHTKYLPHEYKILGLDRTEPWVIQDCIAIGRLGGNDANWHWMLPLLRYRDLPEWREIWDKTLKIRGLSSPSFMPVKTRGGRKLRTLGSIFIGTGKSGSNSWAVSGKKSASGSPMIASDPHLGFLIPSIWLTIGIKCPSYHCVGTISVGAPVMAFGRTAHIAWGGTNLRSINTDLIDVSGLSDDKFEVEEQTIKIRYWKNKTIKIRHTQHGPIISDAHIFPKMKGNFALKWSGHQASDEIGSLLSAMRAKTVEEFRHCFKDFAVPPQNFIAVDKQGNIGHILATWLPNRPNKPPKDICLLPEEADQYWTTTLNADQLPAAINPTEGYVASANNKPMETDLPIGWFFSSHERIMRIQYLLRENDSISIDDMIQYQHDTYSIASVELRNTILHFAFSLALNNEQQAALDTIRGWDGYYRIHSKGALLFEGFLEIFTYDYFKSQDRLDDFKLWERGRFLKIALNEELSDKTIHDVKGSILKGLDKAFTLLHSGQNWGDIHRIELKHFLGNLPIVGKIYEHVDFPTSGSVETIMKSAHEMTVKKHNSFYGSQARHISDMSDINANYFILLGGQDGYLGSENFWDQNDLWNKKQYIQLPLEMEKVKEHFIHKTVFNDANE